MKSAIKQVGCGRFGVTSHYLANDSLNLIELGSKMTDDDVAIEKVDSFTQVDPCIDEKNDKMKKKSFPSW